MMPSPDPERFATLIAGNVVSAVERYRDGLPVHSTMPVTVVSVLVRSLLLVVPTTSSDDLATACNRGLDDVAGVIEIGAPLVEAVDLDDGSVTMRAK